MSNPDLPWGALQKPLSTRAERKYERRVARHKAKAAEAKRVRDAWSMVRVDVFRRDGGCCRAFGGRLKLATINPHELAHTHHLIYRSAGGADVLSNLCLLSPEAHRLEHDHRLRIEGDPNGTLVFTRVNPETGEVLERWESPCPKANRGGDDEEPE